LNRVTGADSGLWQGHILLPLPLAGEGRGEGRIRAAQVPSPTRALARVPLSRYAGEGKNTPPRCFAERSAPRREEKLIDDDKVARRAREELAAALRHENVVDDAGADAFRADEDGRLDGDDHPRLERVAAAAEHLQRLHP
jgi:hypothetical protein